MVQPRTIGLNPQTLWLEWLQQTYAAPTHGLVASDNTMGSCCRSLQTPTWRFA